MSDGSETGSPTYENEGRGRGEFGRVMPQAAVQAGRQSS